MVKPKDNQAGKRLAQARSSGYSIASILKDVQDLGELRSVFKQIWRPDMRNKLTEKWGEDAVQGMLLMLLQEMVIGLGRLFDPAQKGGNINLSLELLLYREDDEDPGGFQERFWHIKKRLYASVKKLRNKELAHRDADHLIAYNIAMSPSADGTMPTPLRTSYIESILKMVDEVTELVHDYRKECIPFLDVSELPSHPLVAIGKALGVETERVLPPPARPLSVHTLYPRCMDCGAEYEGASCNAEGWGENPEAAGFTKFINCRRIARAEALRRILLSTATRKR